MYLYKCWRSTRLIVAIYLVVLGLIGWGIIRHAPAVSTEATAWPYIAISTALLGFVAWILGSIGVGRDIANGSGPFLLSRPRPRKFFVWSDSAVAMAELLTLSLLTVGLLLAAVYLQHVRFGVPENWSDLSGAPAGSQLSHMIAPLISLSMLIYAGLVYSVTYFCTTLVRRVGGGIFLSAAVFILYGWVQKEAPAWAAPFRLSLPRWSFDPFVQYGKEFQLAPHLVSIILLRVAVILLFVFASQIVLERVEIRA